MAHIPKIRRQRNPRMDKVRGLINDLLINACALMNLSYHTGYEEVKASFFMAKRTIPRSPLPRAKTVRAVGVPVAGWVVRGFVLIYNCLVQTSVPPTQFP